MTSKKSRWIGRIIWLWVIFGTCDFAYILLADEVLSYKARQWRLDANAFANPSITFADAKRWLEANNYQVIFWNPSEANSFIGHEFGGDGEYQVVLGQRLSHWGRWPGERVWINLTFRFSDKGAYHNVQTSVFRMQIQAPQTAKSGHAVSIKQQPGP